MTNFYPYHIQLPLKKNEINDSWPILHPVLKIPALSLVLHQE